MKPQSHSYSELPKIHYNLTIDEMWATVKGQEANWGIEGYQVPRKYFDPRLAMWGREREEILKKHKRKWPPEDWPKDKDDPDRKVPPKRPNYLDQVFKWAKSFYDPEKAQAVKDSLAERGIKLDAPPEKKPQVNQRKKFLEEEEEKKKWRAELPQIPDWKEQPIEAVKAKIIEDEAKKEPLLTKLKNRYTRETPQWPRCDRVTVVADAEHCGEKVPFYNTYVKEGEEEEEHVNTDGDEPKKKIKKKLFFPDKSLTWKRAPSWGYPKKKNEPNEQLQAREEKINEKVAQYMETKNLTEKSLMVDVSTGFSKVKNFGKIYWKYHERFPYEKESQYEQSKELNPPAYPGPQHYWKTRPYKRPIKKRKGDDEEVEEKQIEEEDENGKKKYYFNREVTDQKVYRIMRKTVY